MIEPVRSEIDAGIGIGTLDRVDKRNAITSERMSSILDILKLWFHDDSVSIKSLLWTHPSPDEYLPTEIDHVIRNRLTIRSV
jgi:hypothetical protein